MIFLFSKWMALPLTTKALLAKQFGFSQTSSIHVADNRVIQDGYKVSDVEERMNVDAIEAFLSTDETDFNKLWDMLIAKVEGKVVSSEENHVIPTVTTAPITVAAFSPMAQTVEEAPKKKRGRPSKK